MNYWEISSNEILEEIHDDNKQQKNNETERTKKNYLSKKRIKGNIVKINK